MDKHTTYRYPEDASEFFSGTVYQIQDIISKEWSDDKRTTHTCYSFREMVRMLIRRNGIRIVKYDNFN